MPSAREPSCDLGPSATGGHTIARSWTTQTALVPAVATRVCRNVSTLEWRRSLTSVQHAPSRTISARPGHLLCGARAALAIETDYQNASPFARPILRLIGNEMRSQTYGCSTIAWLAWAAYRHPESRHGGHGTHPRTRWATDVQVLLI